MKKWTIDDTLLIYNLQLLDNKIKCKMACFDIDGTIITTKSGKVHAINCDDWKIKFDNCIKVIENLSLQKYKIVFISNQSGIGILKVDIVQFKKKIEDICKNFNCDITVFIATSNDRYRKPRTTIVDEYINIDNNSFFCGDAAGRPKTHNLPKDFSDSDYKFALNLGISFFTPEELFTNEKKDNREKSFYYPISIDKDIHRGKYDPFIPKDKEVIIMCGYPGSGKSYYTKNYIIPCNYVYINQDTLGTFKKCLKVLEIELKNKHNVVIDNTNPDIEKRKEIITIAKKYNYNIRGIYLKTSKDVSLHNMYYRTISSKNQINIIPIVSYNLFNKKFKKLKLEEGYYKIEELDFKLNISDDEYINYNKMLY